MLIFHAKLVDISRNRAFWRGAPISRFHTVEYSNLESPKFELLKCTFNAENFVGPMQLVLVCLQLYRRNSLLKCAP